MVGVDETCYRIPRDYGFGLRGDQRLLEDGSELVQPQVQQPAPQPEPQAGQAGEHPDVALIRSWAEGREFAQEGHKDRSWVAFQLNDLYAQPEWANRPITDKLSHIDTLYKEMRGGGQQRSTPSVLADGSGGGGRQRSRGRSAVDQLSAEQKAVAVHMFPEKAPREAYAAYARGLK